MQDNLWVFALTLPVSYWAGLSAGSVLFVVSVGLSVTMGLMGFVNLAHGAFAMFGGYVIVLAMNSAHIDFAAALAIGFVATAALSVVLERVLYRPLYRAGELDQVLLTIGLIFIFIAGITIVVGPESQPLELPSTLGGQLNLGFMHYRTYSIVLIVISFLIVFGVWLCVRTYADRRADPRHRRQPAHGGVARHQCGSAVHHHLRLRERHGGDRRRPRR